MPTSENPGPAHDTGAIPWRCAGCRHDAAGLLLGMPCPECGRPLDQTSIRPPWLEPRHLRSVQLAARLAIAGTLALALFPLVVSGFRAQGYAIPPVVVVPAILIVTAVAIGAQTFAILRLLWRATSPARRRLYVAAVLLRAPLLFIVFAGSFGFLAAQQQSGTMVTPWKGFLAGGTGVPGGMTPWVGAMLMQALLVVPALAVDVLTARRCIAIAVSISDDRPVWARLQTAFALIAWWLAGAGALCVAIPLTGWWLSPLVWLVGHIALFRAIDRMAGAYAGESPRSGDVRAS